MPAIDVRLFSKSVEMGESSSKSKRIAAILDFLLSLAGDRGGRSGSGLRRGNGDTAAAP